MMECYDGRYIQNIFHKSIFSSNVYCSKSVAGLHKNSMLITFVVTMHFQLLLTVNIPALENYYSFHKGFVSYSFPHDCFFIIIFFHQSNQDVLWFSYSLRCCHTIKVTHIHVFYISKFYSFLSAGCIWFHFMQYIGIFELVSYLICNDILTNDFDLVHHNCYLVRC